MRHADGGSGAWHPRGVLAMPRDVLMSTAMGLASAREVGLGADASTLFLVACSRRDSP